MRKLQPLTLRGHKKNLAISFLVLSILHVLGLEQIPQRDLLSIRCVESRLDLLCDPLSTLICPIWSHLLYIVAYQVARIFPPVAVDPCDNSWSCVQSSIRVDLLPYKGTIANRTRASYSIALFLESIFHAPEDVTCDPM